MKPRLSLLTLPLSLACVLQAAVHAENPGQEARREIETALRENRQSDVYALCRKRLLDAKQVSPQTGRDLYAAFQCLLETGQPAQAEQLLNEAVAAHPLQWRVLYGAAAALADAPHILCLEKDKWVRTRKKAETGSRSCFRADRVRALRWLEQALPLAAAEKDTAALYEFYSRFAQCVLQTQMDEFFNLWDLRLLTDLSRVPEAETLPVQAPPQTLPAGPDGQFFFFSTPDKWTAARSDGERWCWLIEQLKRANPKQVLALEQYYAQILNYAFHIEPLPDKVLARVSNAADGVPEGSLYDYRALDETETVLRLANGLHRIKLPAELNVFKLAQRLIEEHSDKRAGTAPLHTLLAQAYEARLQLGRAAAHWKKAGKTERAAQIEEPWGQLENIPLQAAGTEAALSLRFRNADSVSFEARRIDTARLAGACIAYLKSKPAALNWEKLNLRNPGLDPAQKELLQEYTGPVFAAWNFDLHPRADHQDTCIKLPAPLKEPGACLITAKLPNGRSSQAVLWQAGLAILQKPVDGQTLIYVADARTGKPAPQTALYLLGFRQTAQNPVVIRELTGTTDSQGIFRAPAQDDPAMQWLIATAGLRTFLAFTPLNAHALTPAAPSTAGVMLMTDRPQYTAGETLRFRVCAAFHPGVSATGTSALKSIGVQLSGGTGHPAQGCETALDAQAGGSGEFVLPASMPAGVYQLSALNTSVPVCISAPASGPVSVQIDAPRTLPLGDVARFFVRAVPAQAGRLRYSVWARSGSASGAAAGLLPDAAAGSDVLVAENECAFDPKEAHAFETESMAAMPEQADVQYTIIAVFTAADGKRSTGQTTFAAVRKSIPAAPQAAADDLELVPDKSIYLPGGTIRLRIKSAQPDAAVLFFLRPFNGIYPQPKLLLLKDGLATEEFAAEASDLPDIVVEAVSIRDGRVRTVTRRIPVTPAPHLLSLTLRPEAAVLKPGATAELAITLADHAGKPVSGKVSIAVFDASLIDLSTLSPVDAFFSGWRHTHTPAGDSSLDRLGVSFYSSADAPWQPLLTASPARVQRMPADMPPVSGEGRTAFWDQVSVAENGQAAVRVQLPAVPAKWKIKAWAWTSGPRAGYAESELQTAP